jgi:hypothetical protein
MVVFEPGLPDGIFSNKTSQFGLILEGLGWKMLVYFMGIWYIMWSFDILYGHLVYFMVIWYIL